MTCIPFGPLTMSFRSHPRPSAIGRGVASLELYHRACPCLSVSVCVCGYVLCACVMFTATRPKIES